MVFFFSYNIVLYINLPKYPSWLSMMDVVNVMSLYDSFDMICMDNIMKFLNPSYAINDVIRYVNVFRFIWHVDVDMIRKEKHHIGASHL